MRFFSSTQSFRLIAILLVACSGYTQAQAQSQPNWTWAKSQNGIQIEAQASTTDAAGNIYLVGRYQSVLTLGSIILTSAPNGGASYVVKYNAAGVVQWAGSYTSKYIHFPGDIAVDPQGNVLVTGYFTDSLLFGGNYLRSTGDRDMYLLKYDNNGNAQWANSGGGTKSEFGNAVVADNAGNVYVAGLYGYDNNQATGNSGMFGSTVLNNSGSGDAFLAKYDASGNLLWVKGNGGVNVDQATELAYDDQKNEVVVAGSFGVNTIFEGMALPLVGKIDVFVARFDATGQVVWVKTGGSLEADGVFSIAVDKNSNVLVGLAAVDSVSFGNKTTPNAGPGKDDYLLKYDAAGNEQWVKFIGGDGNARTGGVACDKDGNAYIYNTFNKKIVFGNDTLKVPADDTYLARYDANGKFNWAIGIPSRPAGTSSAVDVMVDKNSSELLVVGTFNSDSMVFGNNAIYGQLTGSVYMARMAPFNPASVAQQPVLTKGMVYPVPASHMLYTTVSKDDYAKVLLYDMNGRVVYDAPVSPAISLQGLQTGTYFIQFSGKAGIATEQILIQQ